jgi:hypothetical protein
MANYNLFIKVKVIILIIAYCTYEKFNSETLEDALEWSTDNANKIEKFGDDQLISQGLDIANEHYSFLGSSSIEIKLKRKTEHQRFTVNED